MHLFTSGLFLAALSATTWAAGTPADRARTIAPYADAQTLIVGYLDTNRLDLDALEAVAKSGTNQAGQEEKFNRSISETKAQAVKWLAEFTKAGGSEIYLVFSLADLPEPKPLLIAPVRANADEKAIGNLLASGLTEAAKSQPASEGAPFERIGSAVVVGHRAALDRVRTIKAADRPEIAKAFEAGGDAPLQIVFVPNADTRRAIEETFPELPAQIGGGPMTAVTRGLMWAAVSVELRPAVAAKAVIQSENATASRAFSEAIDRIFQAAKQDKNVVQQMPAVDELVRALKPTVREDRLIIELSAKTLHSVIGRTLGPPMASARERARRMASMNQIRQLEMACILYANDNKDKWPVDLESLAASKYLNEPKLLVNPRLPDRKVGYVYVRPSPKSGTNIPQNVLIYEAFDTWPEGGIAVGFGDAHVEMISEKSRFDEKLAQSKADAQK